MEHIFHKIILNIFDHIHIMFLYRVFSMLCTDYMLVYIKVENIVIFLPRDIYDNVFCVTRHIYRHM
jgi:hypothetical protein